MSSSIGVPWSDAAGEPAKSCDRIPGCSGGFGSCISSESSGKMDQPPLMECSAVNRSESKDMRTNRFRHYLDIMLSSVVEYMYLWKSSFDLVDAVQRPKRQLQYLRYDCPCGNCWRSIGRHRAQRFGTNGYPGRLRLHWRGCQRKHHPVRSGHRHHLHDVGHV